MFLGFFQINEFWIGQKIWKAESLLLHLSTTFAKKACLFSSNARLLPLVC